MKRFTLTLALILVSITMYGQGIAVQGIARNASKAAIAGETKTFNFTINTIGGGAKKVYEENATITTDPFGVFSHIVGGGGLNASVVGTDTFFDIDFYEELELVVKVDNNLIYKKKLHYTPYAHYAANGVPTGTIIAFAGATAPKGWLLCDGTIIDAKYKRLRSIVGNNTPDLRGRFLRGAGTGDGMTSIDPVNVRQYQGDQIKAHKHEKGNLTTTHAGEHSHEIRYHIHWRSFEGEDGSERPLIYDHRSQHGVNDGGYHKRTLNSGNHKHNITGHTANYGGKETRPYNYGVNYIIKY